MNKTLIDQYIDRQALLSAVENFSIKHDLHGFDKADKFYTELLPGQLPGEGQQYAFEVDLDKCTGCKACVTACHNENGLDPDETWRSVGLIQGGTSENPAIQHITTACHHCAEPACMHGCPTKAYEKDSVTGIVKHLEDQCFGCQYCILKCPYDVPKYNKSKGIVHKCDMCISRLNVGQAPACVRACPTGAIRITIVDKKDLKQNPAKYVNVADAPASDYTYPSTMYKTKRRFPDNMVSYDYFNIQPEHSHLPLVFMLVLTQLSVGAFFADILLMKFIDPSLNVLTHKFHTFFALFVGLFALGASILHLGRPQYAFRAVLGLKTSWLSREIVAFGLFAQLAILYAVCSMFSGINQFISGILGEEFMNQLSYLIVGLGMLGIYCSVKVYKDTRRPFWDNNYTTAKFFMSMGILGFSTILFTSIIISLIAQEVSPIFVMDAFGRTFCLIILVMTVLKLMVESTIFFTLSKGNLTFIKKSALLMTQQLQRYTVLRFALGIAGGVVLPLFILNLNSAISSVWFVISVLLIFSLNLAAELLERLLFFKAVVPLKMPGGQFS